MRTDNHYIAYCCSIVSYIVFLLVIVILVSSSSTSRRIISNAAFVPNWPPNLHHRHHPTTSSQSTHKFYPGSSVPSYLGLIDHTSQSTSSSLSLPANAPDSPLVSRSYTKNSTTSRQIRSPMMTNLQDVGPNLGSSSCQAGKRPAVFGLRCDNGEMVDGELLIKANEPAQIILIGQNLELNFSLALTPTWGSTGDDCTHMDRVKSIPVLTYLTTTSAQVEFNLPWPGSKMPYYMCIRELKETNPSMSPDMNSNNINSSMGLISNKEPWYHQGSHNLVRLYVHEELLPLYMKIINIILLLMLSGLFSGLNLGLMALDKNELAVIISCGSETEKRYARAIEPVRRRGNYLLCSILFSNVLVNSTIAVLLEDFTSGSVAVMTSTIFIVMFGEILPQAFCSRHGLAVGAKTVAITYLCMFLTCPLSYPVSACLDWALGEEINHAYDRERLMEFIRITSDYNNLETEEVNIISGALKLKRVHINEVMTRIEDAFMLDVSSSLDFETVKAIVESGYSRVPIHEANNKRHIIALLLTKDLALIDPDDKTPVQTLISFYNHPVMFMFEDETLHSALNEFKTGKSHMAFVRRVIDDGDRDPVYEVTGLVTFEDVVEEILQMEINDETDTITDNRRKRRRKEAQVRSDFLQFTSRQSGTSGDWSHDICVTPQLCLAAYQFLSTNVQPFTKKFIRGQVLKKLLAQKIYYKIRVEPVMAEDGRISMIGMENNDAVSEKNPERILYKAGEPADYFIMILDGRVSVVCGSEKLAYEGGPFSYYGKGALQLDKNVMLLELKNTTSSSNSISYKQLPKQSNSRKISPSFQLQLAAPIKSEPPAHPKVDGPFTRDNCSNELLDNNTISMSSINNVANSTVSNDHSALNKNHGGSSQSVSMSQHQAQPIIEANQLSNEQNPNPKRGVISQRNSIANGMVNARDQSYSNITSLSQTFVPDYTVKVITNVSYLKITRDQYQTALKATLLYETPQVFETVESDSYSNKEAEQKQQQQQAQSVDIIELEVMKETHKLLQNHDDG